VPASIVFDVGSADFDVDVDRASDGLVNQVGVGVQAEAFALACK
jgi:hypothetical protein